MPHTLSFGATTATSITFTAGQLAGAGNFTLELNRAEDFASDDSVTYTFAKPIGDVTYSSTANGLPTGTTWFGRVVTASDESPVAFRATTRVAENTAYAGLSVEKAVLVIPEATGYLAAASVEPGFPLSNLLTDSPAAIAKFADYLLFETSGTAIDTVALLGGLLTDDMVWNVRAYNDAGRTALAYQSGNQPLMCSPTIGPRHSYHALHRLPAPTTARYWRIDIDRAGAPTTMFRNLVVGLERASSNASRGWSHGMSDLGSSTRSRFGDPDRVFGWRGRTVDFTMSWLSETEYQTKWAPLPQLVGKTKPVLVIPNSKRNVWLNDRIGFGPITDWRGENVHGSKFAVPIAVDSIY